MTVWQLVEQLIWIIEVYITISVSYTHLNVFANTGTNVSVVFFDNSKSSDKVILIDASKLGEEYQEGPFPFPSVLRYPKLYAASMPSILDISSLYFLPLRSPVRIL